ncbi:hypothetical protein KAFR_0B03950 [Kazachstania africana CBS 2517]|uniref:Zn(2)-C6 fungal-type domain-containing protein n=1 Tax=Kazachstania africana (strain ATCC 22294 / BCRC 22015 / CBS 2517 / CECT 1963 / NBRC 1671 / NRRL Y-8276) TaxID=1071382 RepID=H2AQP1_KAZAF|nr:hypothetical protein KAFR_0B03950 [Kazachstania africana CBS 2517]CCF56691.1 hypothetical protein KAFR_0B03950 [Kazachstania africana CBS 2517]
MVKKEPGSSDPRKQDSDVNHPSSSNYRVTQACDRCRSKKTRCDGRKPQCSQCAAVGFECKVSDKLIRKAYPRGYTESIEERVRELEAENRRLLALCDLKEQQISLVAKYSSNKSNILPTDRCIIELNSDSDCTNNIKGELNKDRQNDVTTIPNSLPLNISQTNLYLLNQTQKKAELNNGNKMFQQNQSNVSTSSSSSPFFANKLNSNGTIRSPESNTTVSPLESHTKNLKSNIRNNNTTTTTHVCDGICCTDKLHPQPVATNYNDPTSISFEQSEAPGLVAAKALKSINNQEEATQLAILVSLSVPRSTEEILFIPQLLAKIRQVHGFTSKQCLYTVSLLSSLKNSLPSPKSDFLMDNSQNSLLLKNTNIWQINDLNVFFTDLLKFNISNDSKTSTLLSFDDIDDLTNLYFNHWSNLIPVLNEEEFFNRYNNFKIQCQSFIQGNQSNNLRDYKFFGCFLMVMCQMGLLIKLKEHKSNNSLFKILTYYHQLTYILPKNPVYDFATTSIKSVQLLALLLFYHLNMGNIEQIYELRGNIISMAHQLRLHRCPSAVLTGSGSTMQKLEQSNRRLLFWTIYYLDVFSSLQLGVPRLLKDYEIECALPVDNTTTMDAIDGTSIKLEGTVSQISLTLFRFAKVLGNIVDSIFKRNMSTSISRQVALIHENALDNWRSRLPEQFQFKLDVNGTINLNDLDTENSDTIFLIVFYFLAKCMIHLPVCSTKVDLEDKVTETGNDVIYNDRFSTSYVSLQQSTNTMLNALRMIRDKYLPMPFNVSRTLTRFTLISAKGSLDYIKGGSLFIDNKKLLLDCVQDIEANRKLDLPGIISWHSLKLLDLTLNLFLQNSNTKPEKIEKLLQKKLNYYNKLMGKPLVKNLPIQKRTNQNKGNNNDEPSRKKVKKELENDINSLHPILIDNEGVTPSDAAPLINKTNSNTNNPVVTTQNEFAEALQVDPILNSDYYQFSNLDLATLFNSDKLNKINSHHGSSINLIDQKPFNDSLIPKFSQVNTASNSTLNMEQLLRNQGKFNISPNIFSPNFQSKENLLGNSKVNNNLLYSNLKNNSNNQSLTTMMMLLNNEIPFSSINSNTGESGVNKQNANATENDNVETINFKQDLTNKNESGNMLSTENYLSDFSYIIDGSLGLAPLLANPFKPTGENNLVNVSSIETTGQCINPKVLSSQSSDANKDDTDLNLENGAVQRRPRRYNGNFGLGGTGMNSNFSVSDLLRPDDQKKREKETLNDLFNWQNSD